MVHRFLNLFSLFKSSLCGILIGNCMRFSNSAGKFACSVQSCKCKELQPLYYSYLKVLAYTAMIPLSGRSDVVRWCPSKNKKKVKFNEKKNVPMTAAVANYLHTGFFSTRNFVENKLRLPL